MGQDADVTIWNPRKQFTVDAETLQHRHKLTPYQGRTLEGVVETTFLRGKKIYDHGEFVGEPGGLLLGVDLTAELAAEGRGATRI